MFSTKDIENRIDCIESVLPITGLPITMDTEVDRVTVSIDPEVLPVQVKEIQEFEVRDVHPKETHQDPLDDQEVLPRKAVVQAAAVQDLVVAEITNQIRDWLLTHSTHNPSKNLFN